MNQQEIRIHDDYQGKYDTAALAKEITWADSRQSFFIAQLMVDKELTDDFLRAYAYFRWIDDVIDVNTNSNDERFQFINRQGKLIDKLYKKEFVENLTYEEKMLAELINNDQAENSGLQSFIRNMFALIEFDVYRKGRVISRNELIKYSNFFA